MLGLPAGIAAIAHRDCASVYLWDFRVPVTQSDSKTEVRVTIPQLRVLQHCNAYAGVV